MQTRPIVMQLLKMRARIDMYHRLISNCSDVEFARIAKHISAASLNKLDAYITFMALRSIEVQIFGKCHVQPRCQRAGLELTRILIFDFHHSIVDSRHSAGHNKLF